MRNPVILLTFEDDGSVSWLSAGWSRDPRLMKEAKSAINRGDNKEEVIANLEAVGFTVLFAEEPK
jgi:hypothetical protein